MYSSVESSLLVKRALHPAHQVTLFQRQKSPGVKPLLLLLEQDPSHSDDKDHEINEDHNHVEDISVDSSYLEHSNPPKSVPRTIVFNKDGSNPTSNVLWWILASMVLMSLLISPCIFHELSFSDASTNHSTPTEWVLPVVKPFRPVQTVHTVVQHVFFRAEARSLPSMIRRQRLTGSSNKENGIRTSTQEEEEGETELLDKQDSPEWDNFWTTHLGGIVL